MVSMLTLLTVLAVTRSRKLVSSTEQLTIGVQSRMDNPRGIRRKERSRSTRAAWNTKALLHLTKQIKYEYLPKLHYLGFVKLGQYHKSEQKLVWKLCR